MQNECKHGECIRCAHGRNCINGRYCTLHGVYVQHIVNLPCKTKRHGDGTGKAA